MAWWIVFGFCVAITLASYILCEKFGEFFVILGILFTIISLILLVACGINTSECIDEESLFVSSKYIIENEPKNAQINITLSKPELNAWLCAAQYARSNQGVWSFYSDAVLDLELIK